MFSGWNCLLDCRPDAVDRYVSHAGMSGYAAVLPEAALARHIGADDGVAIS